MYPSRGAPTQDIPHSVARKAVIQSMTKVKEWEVQTEGRNKKALSPAEIAARERAYAAFDAAYPQEWLLSGAVAVTEDADLPSSPSASDAMNTLTLSSEPDFVPPTEASSSVVSPSVEAQPQSSAPSKKTRKRKSQLAMLLTRSDDTADSDTTATGRGKRARRELDPDAYNTRKHHVDHILK